MGCQIHFSPATHVVAMSEATCYTGPWPCASSLPTVKDRALQNALSRRRQPPDSPEGAESPRPTEIWHHGFFARACAKLQVWRLCVSSRRSEDVGLGALSVQSHRGGCRGSMLRALWAVLPVDMQMGGWGHQLTASYHRVHASSRWCAVVCVVVCHTA
jgi:hypothetical protein